MPTVLQMTLRLLFIVQFVLFWSIWTVLRLIGQWWNHGRSGLFLTIRHQRPTVLDQPGWTHRFVKLSKLQMHYVETGNPNNPHKMVFLHGFPEFWYSWRFQLRYFAPKFHCIALDLRGYNESDKPSGVSNYTLELLVEDVRELIEKLGGKAIVIGHDWGGLVGWSLVQKYSPLLERFIVINAPHPAVGMKLIRTRSAQLLKSWYVFMFQLPFLAEIVFYIRDYAFLVDCFRGKDMGLTHKENFTDADLEAWKYVFSRPNGLTPPINYYRAAIRSSISRHLPPVERIRTPTLIIWGELDCFIELDAAEMSWGLCADAQLESIPDASHWCQQDVPDRVNELIDVFTATPVGRPSASGESADSLPPSEDSIATGDEEKRKRRSH